MSKYILPTFTGKMFDLENPHPEMICIEDIAHHLSIENRYNGATRFPYSVAQHSLLVSLKAPEHLKLEALLHDVEETWYKDFSNPWKRLIKAKIGSELFNETMYVARGIALDKFHCSSREEDWKEIKDIELRITSTEIVQLLWDWPIEYWQHSWQEYPAYSDIKIYAEYSTKIEQKFKEEFFRLARN